MWPYLNQPTWVKVSMVFTPIHVWTHVNSDAKISKAVSFKFTKSKIDPDEAIPSVKKPLKNYLLLPLFASSLIPIWCVIWYSPLDLSRPTIASTQKYACRRRFPDSTRPLPQMCQSERRYPPLHPTIPHIFLHHIHHISQFPVVNVFNIVLCIPNPMSSVHPPMSIFHAITSLLGHE